jgi:hypothetical protein
LFEKKISGGRPEKKGMIRKGERECAPGEEGALAIGG